MSDADANEEVETDEVDTDEVDTDEVADDGDDSADAGADSAQAVLEHLVRSVVENPDQVRVNADDDGRSVQYTVEVGPGDMGRVIGRRGRIANAIRTVVRAAASQDDVRVDVEFLD